MGELLKLVRNVSGALALATPMLAAAEVPGLPELPSVEAILNYQPKIPLRVYTADKVLIGEFGEHREFIPIAKIPPMMRNALLAIEDARFYEHSGVDWKRAAGAVKGWVGGGRMTGFSTITMQIPRNFMLSRERTAERKLAEIRLAWEIEQKLSKDQILEVYMNQVYLGQRAYGFGAAARTYFNKPLDRLSLAQMAMLAGLPQNPSDHNPVANPQKARKRQLQVLNRLRELKWISAAQYAQAVAEPLRVAPRAEYYVGHSQYVAEMARQYVVAQYKDDAYTKGYTVTTTIGSRDQEAAWAAVRRNVLEFDKRRGYRGPEARITLPPAGAARDQAIAAALQKRPSSEGLLPAVVLSASPSVVRARLASGEAVDVRGAGLSFASRALSKAAARPLRIAPGSVVRVTRSGKDAWAISQLPQVASAFVSLDPETGAVRALVGGFDYNLQKFNHVTQAWRQPGSAFKPILYSAALEHGFWPGTRILDAPLDMPGENAGATWSPRNDDGEYDGEVTLRQALTRSKNIASVRLLRAVGVDRLREHMRRFGFDPARHPANYTAALGTGSVTPLQMAGAYSVFANGGFRVQPYVIDKVTDGAGKVLVQARAPAPRQEAQRVLDARNAFIIDSMMRDVARYGTAAQAGAQLGRGDVAGKTGTTTDAMDGWFAGYAGGVVAVSWMGYDEPRSMGRQEFGSTLALPAWIDYMGRTVAGKPEAAPARPDGIVDREGDLIYAEYMFGTAVDALDFEELELPGQPAQGTPPDEGAGAAQPVDGTAPAEHPPSPPAPPPPASPPLQ